MTCHEFDLYRAAYIAGTLMHTDARRLERHASTCARCEAALTAAVGPIATQFAPPLPPNVREATLQAVAVQARARRTRRNWMRGGAGLAAAAVLLLWLSPRTAVRVPGSVVAQGADTMVSSSVDAGRLAAARAVSEFDALDAATRELRTALDASPSDPQLQAFLASVTAQRAQLLRRVQDAQS